jgi:hypothetical protein
MVEARKRYCFLVNFKTMWLSAPLSIYRQNTKTPYLGQCHSKYSTLHADTEKCNYKTGLPSTKGILESLFLSRR